MTTVDCTIKRAPMAKVEVDTPFYVGTVEALYLRDPLFDLIIGNVPGARSSDDLNPEWGVVTAVATRAQARRGKDPKPLKMKEVTDEMSINKKDLIKMQEEDLTLQKLKQLKGTETRKRYVVSYEKQGGIWYRIRQKKDDVGDPRKQILVPKSLRERVMGVAHDSRFARHLGLKKTEDRIQTNSFWPGLRKDVTSLFRSCDVCQKTVAIDLVPRASLGDMPLIDQPYKIVAVDLEGPMAPASDKGHRYILTLVDYATRYPEAVPLTNIDAETVAEALLDMHSRVGIPEEVLSDLGTQITSDCMKEVSRLLSIRRFTTSSYHPACNGLAEKFNGTLKRMLKMLCHEQPRQWHRFINTLLFAYREARQEATEFSPFVWKDGRTVCTEGR